MATLKVKWRAKGKGIIEIPFEDIDLTIEEWDSLSDEEQEQIARDIVNGDDETIVYGNLRSFEVVDGD